MVIKRINIFTHAAISHFILNDFLSWLIKNAENTNIGTQTALSNPYLTFLEINGEIS
jgi:hypothetical protein